MLKLSEGLKDYVLAEFRRVADMMAGSSVPTEQLFYYSALYAAVLRLLNIECSPQLVHLQVILQATYSMFDARLTAMRQGREDAIGLPSNLFPKLLEQVEELANRIAKDEGYDDVLQSLTLLAFSTTGNGHYLLRTGRLTI